MKTRLLFSLALVACFLVGFQFVYAQLDSLLLAIKNDTKEKKGMAFFELGKYYSRNQPDSALYYLEQGIVLAGDEKDYTSLVSLLNVKANTLRDKGSYEEALETFQTMFELAQQEGNNRGLARYYLNCGILLKKQGKWDEALGFYEKSIPFYEKDKDIRGAGRASISTGNIYADRGELEKAIAYYLQAESYAGQAQDSIGLASSLNALGSVYYEKGEISQAFSYYQQSAQIKEKTGDLRGTGIVYLNMGNLESHIGLYDQSEKTMLKAISLFEKIAYPYGLAAAYTNLGTIKKSQKQEEKAKIYFQQALASASEVGDKHMIALAHINLGFLWQEEDSFPQAKIAFENSLEIFQELGDQGNMASGLSSLAEIQAIEGDFRQAKLLNRQALALARESGTFEALGNIYKSMSMVAAMQGQYQLAFNSLKSYSRLNDSLLNAESRRQFNTLNQLYETEKKEKKIQLLQKDTEIQEKQLKIARNRRNMLIGGIVVLLLLAGIIVYALLLRIQKNKQLHLRDQRIHAQQQQLIQLDLEASRKELAFKERRLADFTAQLVQKNGLLRQLEEELETMQVANADAESARLKKLSELHQARILTEEDWRHFRQLFEEVHGSFIPRLLEDFPQLSKADRRLLSLMKLGLDNDRIADMLAISYDSVKKSRYRLRKKLQLEQEVRLEDFVTQV